MKKICLIIAVSAVVALISCNTGNNAYTITGTVEGTTDEDITVYLQNRANRQFEKLDSTVIKNGRFVFKGVQDSAVVRYLSFVIAGNQTNMNFFLENGDIKVKLIDRETISITGTPANDIYQAFNDEMASIDRKLITIYKALNDSVLSDEQIADKNRELVVLENEWLFTVKERIRENITNVVGIHLLTSYSYCYTDYSELTTLLANVPDQFRGNQVVIGLTKLAETLNTIEIGRQFVDFAMKTPNGQPVKLSDYVGKGKVVLLDFWASWCGPCRVEMPNLIKTYEQYRNKGFEIVGVSLDKDNEAWKNGIKQLGITWPQMSDLKYWDCEGSNLYGVRSIPETVLIDEDGVIMARGLRGEALQNKLAEILL
ncbi:Thiol-disulfide oxidoreductase ResA [termite gut metagenome]|uniref:Thiol-disulfide oxidoreductase ResA n=1 Tax=termite gut metagenome TaxID=433724 RepID=A0A5J4SNU6_9ZZZZ